MTLGNNDHRLPILPYRAVHTCLPLFPSQVFTGKVICMYLTLPLKPLFSGNQQIHTQPQTALCINLAQQVFRGPQTAFQPPITS